MTEPHTDSTSRRVRQDTRPRRGRLAGRALVLAFGAFDMVLVGAALSTPALMLWVALVAAVAVQIGFFAYAGGP